MRLNTIEPWIRTFISDRQMVVLRDKNTGLALHTSYTEEGLRWATDKHMRSLYYHRAELSVQTIDNKPHVSFKARGKNGLEKSRNVIVEKFVPKDHFNSAGKLNARLQSAEYVAVHRALKLLYNVEPRQHTDGAFNN